MNIEEIIKAWRDKEYRESLDDELRAVLPENPAGSIELSEDELADANGGSETAVSCISGATLDIVCLITTWPSLNLQ